MFSLHPAGRLTQIPLGAPYVQVLPRRSDRAGDDRKDGRRLEMKISMTSSHGLLWNIYIYDVCLYLFFGFMMRCSYGESNCKVQKQCLTKVFSFPQ